MTSVLNPKRNKVIMEELKTVGRDVVWLYLEKLEKLNERERAVLIRVIEVMGYPMYVSPTN